MVDVCQARPPHLWHAAAAITLFYFAKSMQVLSFAVWPVVLALSKLSSWLYAASSLACHESHKRLVLNSTKSTCNYLQCKLQIGMEMIKYKTLFSSDGISTIRWSFLQYFWCNAIEELHRSCKISCKSRFIPRGNKVPRKVSRGSMSNLVQR